ncbi:unnamed protein product [Adineta steineri]|uniref:Uncharacterized protein n=2 Tax=Adineta steineri TaxID=433720 RepID=A0A819HQQ0_9BILA|nr:unnamed protein product [Adineta steineri]CAF3906116.1 unnamed protein product [Adineta steineri]
MKVFLSLLLTVGIACGAVLPSKPDCSFAFCIMSFQVCPDGTPAPVPADGCCPSLSACKAVVTPVKPSKPNCAFTMCTMIMLTCADGKPAPVPADGCCPSLSACKTSAVDSRSNPLGSLGSLLSGSNILQTLSTATHGTNLGTVLSIVNLLNNVQLLSNDIHQIPLLINQTLGAILNTTGQAGQIVVDQLIGALGNAQQKDASRDLLGLLGQNANLLSSITHLLPQGTSISQILTILNLLNNINALNQDIHQIPAVLNQTLSAIFQGAGQAGQVVIDQLMGLVGAHQQAASRDLLGLLGQNANLLSSITHLLPQGTSISQILTILNLLNNINALNQDIHQIPVVLNQTLAAVFQGAGQAGQVVIDQLMGLVGVKPQVQKRDLLGMLGQNANLLSSITHLLPQGTSISQILTILNLLNNINALNQDIHQIPAVLNQTLAAIFQGAGQAGQVVIDQLMGLVGAHQQAASRDLLGLLGQNANLLSSITHLLPQGTSISQILTILNLLNNINALNQDIHQIPVVLNQTLSAIFQGAGQAGQVVIDQLMGLVGAHPQAASRDLLGLLGQNANLLSSITHLLPQGTSISQILSILNLLNNINALNQDIHQIPAVLNQTLAAIFQGAGQAGQVVIDQLLGLVGAKPQAASRDLLGLLGQNANLLSSITHLLPQGTSISTVLSILNMLNNINALNQDIHQIPALLQETLQGLLAGVQNIVPQKN